MVSNLRIVVTGLIAQHPLGGVTWDYLQYVIGLARLGHDVFYLEDLGEWPYDERGAGGRASAVEDCSRNVAYLESVMDRFGFSERWAFRCPIGPRWFGLSDHRRAEVVASADLVVNVSGTLISPGRYRDAGRLAYIDSDPVFTQVRLAQGDRRLRDRVDAADVHFSFGERLGAGVPDTGHHWRPTRQPIVLAEWTPRQPHRGVYTTVMNWASYKAVTDGERAYGQKDVEFKRYLDLPRAVAPVELEVAVRSVRRRRKPTAPVQRLIDHGWRVVDPLDVCADLDAYRRYVETSKAEWSVAKEGYVVGQPGWFSCRSACYLAAGRPTVVQDTGFSDVLPAGEGIVPFSTQEEAVEGIRSVESRYAAHSCAAREIAVEYFDSDRELRRLVEEAMGAAAPATPAEVPA